MRVIGYCTSCHKIAYVRVSAHEMAMSGARRVLSGICGHCEEQQEKERREKWLR